MKMYFALGALLLTGVAHAQTSEAYWRSDIVPTPTIQQAVVTALTPAGAPGTGSTATAAIINQTGQNNRFSFEGAAGNTGNQITFTQMGQNNQLDFSLTGSNNTYLLEQLGNRNVLDLKNMQTNGVRLEIEQIGDGNGLQTNGYPLSNPAIPLRITQTGGMRLIIN
ncbi:hypothetical protein F5984_25035 [Rudanella paleaurantiibacter]|uniref:Curlin n=1 Tax=Rudanella paleaurantiibacter TaxID=2614655 RepID=A0A7J5TSG6_9BACT|nr:hypothetical protein [Rudanella paleaurantiibacter]KAB7726145.1 hypothetical protein F5984_25035 [Rudanella paleaurantiibacter]